MAPRAVALALGALIAAVCVTIVRANADIYTICQKELRPTAATNPRVVSNKMGEKFAEVTVAFGHPQGTNNQVGCAGAYRIELMDGSKVAMKENGLEPPNPLATEVKFTRRVVPGATHRYRITAINTNTKPPLESEPAYTPEFTAANGPPVPKPAPKVATP